MLHYIYLCGNIHIGMSLVLLNTPKRYTTTCDKELYAISSLTSIVIYFYLFIIYCYSYRLTIKNILIVIVI